MKRFGFVYQAIVIHNNDTAKAEMDSGLQEFCRNVESATQNGWEPAGPPVCGMARNAIIYTQFFTRTDPQ